MGKSTRTDVCETEASSPAKANDSERTDEELRPILSMITGMSSNTAATVLINEIYDTYCLPEGMDETERDKRLTALLETLAAIGPESEFEGMLAAQMIGTHNAAMDCLRCAMLPTQTFEGRNQNLKHAAKLLSIYTQQMGAMDKHRGKGPRKVTVGHLNVETGGQAVVGTVETDEPGRRQEATARNRTKDVPEDPDDIVDMPSASEDEDAEEPDTAKIRTRSRRVRKS